MSPAKRVTPTGTREFAFVADGLGRAWPPRGGEQAPPAPLSSLTALPSSSSSSRGEEGRVIAAHRQEGPGPPSPSRCRRRAALPAPQSSPSPVYS